MCAQTKTMDSFYCALVVLLTIIILIFGLTNLLDTLIKVQVITASVIASLGVASTIIFNNIWKKKEHTFNLKKDVYLSAAEAISEAIGSIKKYGNLEISDIDVVSGFQQKSSAIAKVFLIGDQSLRKDLRIFMREYNGSILRLMAFRLPLLNVMQTIKSTEATIGTYDVAIDELIKIMRSHNLNGIDDPQRWNPLKSWYEFNVKNRDKLLSERDTLANSLRPLRIELFKKSIEEAQKLSEYRIPLQESARKELGLEFDQEAEKTWLSEDTKFETNILNDFLNSINKQPNS